MKPGLLIAGLVGSAITASQPREIRATPGVIESLMIVSQVQVALCKKLEINPDRCGQLLEAELLHVRKFVDEICDKEKPEVQDACVNQGVEWILDHKVIPAKVKILNTPLLKT